MEMVGGEQGVIGVGIGNGKQGVTGVGIGNGNGGEE